MSLLVPSQTAGIGSVRWDEARAQHGEDVIALSVADMDFRAPQQVTDAIMDRAGQGAFCYTYLPPSFHELVSEWFARRHGWAFGPEAVVPVGRVVEALPALLQEFTSDGARIVVPTPAYGPIPEAVRAAGREVVPWALRAGSRYEFDLTSLAGLLEQSDALILTNPHNPTGRVWEEAELSDIAAIARRAGALVISDEVHADLLMPGFAFTSFTACAASTQPAISFTSPGKTFNMAGLETVNMIIPNGDVRERAARAVYDAGYHNPRFFTEVATRAAYTHGELWLDELLALLAQHVSLLEQHVTGEGSAVRLRRVEGTFLAWLDCRELQLSDRQIQERLGEHGLVLSLGSDFSAGEEGFVRMNLAVPTPRIEAALERFTAALA